MYHLTDTPAGTHQNPPSGPNANGSGVEHEFSNAQLIDDLRCLAETCFPENKASFESSLREIAGLMIGFGCCPCVLEGNSMAPAIQPAKSEAAQSDRASVAPHEAAKPRSAHPVGNTGYTSPKRDDAPKTVPSLNVGGSDRG